MSDSALSSLFNNVIKIKFSFSFSLLLWSIFKNANLACNQLFDPIGYKWTT